jgi:hypothetical protein
MVIQIVKSVQIGTNWFVKGQEYATTGTTVITYASQFTDCIPCEFPDVQKGLHYQVAVDEKTVAIPWMFCAVLDGQDEPSTDMRGYWALYDERATKDTVVYDGDYIDAARRVLNLDIRQTGAEYDGHGIAELERLKAIWEKV